MHGQDPQPQQGGEAATGSNCVVTWSMANKNIKIRQMAVTSMEQLFCRMITYFVMPSRKPYDDVSICHLSVTRHHNSRTAIVQLHPTQLQLLLRVEVEDLAHVRTML
jgi:hypothetical protein